MSELSAFRDHARRMATSGHKDPCGVMRDRDHGRGTRWVAPDPDCPGCVSDADRALWARLADEVDAYLSHDEEGLFA